MRALLDLLFPPTCGSCGAAADGLLCERCWARFPWLRGGCARCAAPRVPPAGWCARCRVAPPPYASVHAPALYEGVARDLLMRFKLGGERRSADLLARLMADAIAIEPTVVTAVPATRASVVARGFNPAEELARGVSRALGWPYRSLLRKSRQTSDSAGLSRDARRRNLAGSFRPREQARGRVLLVDDIVTTGATAEECARALLDAGAEQVHVLAFARTP